MNEHIIQFFAYSHLPVNLQEVSKPFTELAGFITTLPRNPERTVALRKLLEAKDAAVRAFFAKSGPSPDDTPKAPPAAQPDDKSFIVDGGTLPPGTPLASAAPVPGVTQ